LRMPRSVPKSHLCKGVGVQWVRGSDSNVLPRQRERQRETERQQQRHAQSSHDIKEAPLLFPPHVEATSQQPTALLPAAVRVRPSDVPELLPLCVCVCVWVCVCVHEKGEEMQGEEEDGDPKHRQRTQCSTRHRHTETPTNTHTQVRRLPVWCCVLALTAPSAS
jgi:hypothetical protein